MSGNELREKFVSWCMDNCSRFFSGLQTWLAFKFTGTSCKGETEVWKDFDISILYKIIIYYGLGTQ